jgi:ribonuclease Z
LLQVGLNPAQLAGVVLTHSHADHIYGLPVLLFQLALVGREAPLPIYGLPETLRVARQIVTAFELEGHCVPHEWRSVEAGSDISVPGDERQEGQLHIETVEHSRPTIGLRITAPNGCAAAYSGDTQPCPGLVRLALGVQWLIHECTTPQPFAGHSTPEDVAHTAVEAGVECIGIVHYDPVYVLPKDELLTRIAAGGFQGEVRILGDMDAIMLSKAS